MPTTPMQLDYKALINQDNFGWVQINAPKRTRRWRVRGASPPPAAPAAVHPFPRSSNIMRPFSSPPPRRPPSSSERRKEAH